jgi:hypothetical protein
MSKTKRRPFMNAGLLRRVAPSIVAFLAAGAAGCACCPTVVPQNLVYPKEHVVLLRAERQQNGRWKAIAFPDHLVVSGYSVNPESIVIWPYRHKSTRITFKPSKPAIPDPACNDESGECRLTLPRGLSAGTRYKYTITGKLDDGSELEPNDPDFEVDR